MNILTRVLAGALLAFGIVVAVLYFEVRGQRSVNAELLARVESLDAVRVAAVAAGAPRADVIAAADSAIGAAEVNAGTPPALPTSGKNPDKNSDNVAAAMGAMVRQLVDSDAGREMIMQAGVAALRQQYPDLAQALGIPEEKAQELLQLLARQRVDMSTDILTLQSGTQEDREARAERTRSFNTRQQAHEGEIAALLGDKYSQWQEYQRTATQRAAETQQRRQVEELRAAVSAPGRPVADAAFETLRIALDAEKRRIQTESSGITMQQQLERLDADHRRLLDVAATHLDPLQLENYRRHLRQEADQMRMVLGMVGAMGLSDGSD